MANSRVIKDKNLITISFGDETRVTVLDKLYQHDKGQILQFKDIPDGAQVEFSNSKMEKSIPEIVKDGAVPVPNSIVAENETVDVRVKYIDENSETTVKEVKLFVINGKEADYEIDPENEQTFREEIEGILNETKDAAKEAADKVEVNRKYLDEMEKKSTDTIENITTVGEAQINAINDTAVSQIKAINGTAQAQIESINNVATKNIEAETNSIVQAAQGQIDGINQVANGQIDAINQKAAVQINAIIGTANTHIDAINKTATSQINAINQTAQAQSKALQEQGDGLKYDLAVKEKHTIILSAGAYSDLIDVNEYDAIQVNSISCNGTDTISESLKLEVIKFKDGEQVGDEFLEKYNAIADLTDCDSIKLFVAYRGGISDVATVWYTLIVWDAKKEIEKYVERVEDTVLIKPTASGTEMVLNDSSNMNIQELHLYGKSEQKTTKGIQLLDLSSMGSGTGDGLTYTNRGDGSVQVSGTATSQAGNIWFKGKYDTNSENLTTLLTLEAGKKYYIKNCMLFEGTKNINSQTEVIEVSAEEYPEGRRITGVRNPRQVVGKTYNEVIYPLIAESSTAVEWEAYTGGEPSPNPEYPQEISYIENLTVSVAGKNLLDCSNKDFSTKCYINATATMLGRTLQNNLELGYCFPVAQGKYNISASTGFKAAFCNEKLDENKNATRNIKGVVATNAKATIEAKTDGYIYVCDSTDFYKNEKNLMISKIETNEYEPYKPIQSVTFNHILNGIGDVKDELIVRADGTGQIIRRIKEIILDEKVVNSRTSIIESKASFLDSVLVEVKGITDASNYSQTNYKNILCNKLQAVNNIYANNIIGCGYTGIANWIRLRLSSTIGTTIAEISSYLKDNPLEVLYVLNTPITTDLSAEEVQKVLALHTYKPVTTVWNDQNADMEITYVADAKNYIDNKLAEIQALTLEGGN